MRKIAILVILLSGWALSNAQSVNKEYLMGRFDPATDKRFVKIEDGYSSGSARGGLLHKDTYAAFLKMHEAAKKDGVNLVIISATRNFDSQKRIWENKWEGRTLVDGKDLTRVSDAPTRAKTILLYSSMPGTSRHHWGTDMDLNSLENSFFSEGEGLKIYSWLTAHAHEYGFCQPYTSKSGGRTGYEEEKWHWSYLPLSKEFLKKYTQQIKLKDINGFAGSETAAPLDVINKYVAGVACK